MVPIAGSSKPRFSIFAKGLLLVLLPFVAQLVFSSVLLQRQRQLESSQRWALHTKDVISHVESLLSRLTEAHMHLQGEFLGVMVSHQPIHDLNDLSKTIDELPLLVHDNPAQHELALDIARRAKIYAAWYQRAHQADFASPEVRQSFIAELPSVRANLDHVRRSLKRFVTSEEQLDARRLSELKQSNDVQWLVMWLWLGLSALGALIAVMMFSRSISRRLGVLASNIGRLTRGQALAARIAGNDELSDLDVAFHQMAQTLDMAATKEREHAKELEAHAHELAATNAELSQRTQEVEMFVYSVSHDLRSPLINLQGFSKELELSCKELHQAIAAEGVPPGVQAQMKALLDTDIAESLRFIQNAVSRLAGIIDALLRLSRAGRIEYHLQELDLNRITRRVTDALKDTATQRGATFDLKPLPPAWGDPVAIEQVFANLIGNAVNYLSPERPGRIEVGTVPSPPEDAKLVTLYVRDNGLGIPESGSKNLFRAFQRFHPKSAEGEGIGLAVVRRVVERHGGRIYVDSKVGEGSTFYIALPRKGGRSQELQPASKPGTQK